MRRELGNIGGDFSIDRRKTSEVQGQFEIPDSQIEVETVPVSSGKKSLGTRIELTWDSKQVTDQELRSVLDGGHSVFDDRFSKGGRRVGKVVLRVQVEAGATEEEIEVAEQSLREQLNSLVNEALDVVKEKPKVSAEMPKGPSANQAAQERARKKAVADKRWQAQTKSRAGTVKREIEAALQDDED